MATAAATVILMLSCLLPITSAAEASADFVITFPQMVCTVNSADYMPGFGSDVDIYRMDVKSVVRNRFAHTTVISYVKNCDSSAKEAAFSVILPEAAFISGFVMEVDGRNYTAYVRERAEARETYEQAVALGLGAGHVEAGARDSNRITVSANVEPQTRAVFYLTYEELLTRRDSHYEIVINLHPGQPVKDMAVEVEISESKRITNLKTPPMRTGNQIVNSIDGLDLAPFVQTIDESTTRVGFSPNLEKQKQMSKALNNRADDSLSGQFVVQYDVERDPSGGEVLIEDGFFVHFFAPTDLPRLPIHVVFLLDVSISMYGKKLQQLKDAMYKILDDLGPGDIFHLISFHDRADVWILNDNPYSKSYTRDDLQRLTSDSQLLQASPASPGNIEKAKTAVSRFRAKGNTNIYVPLRIALRLVQLSKLTNSDSNHQSMLIFLTDGDPTVFETSTARIVKETTKLNNAIGKTPIYALSLGDKANRAFLQKLSLSNRGFPKHIYEASDISLQLEGFYRLISSPELSDVAFRYESSVKNLTQFRFPLHFTGSELTTAGQYDIVRGNGSFRNPQVTAWNGEEDVSFQPTVNESASNIERVWAYLTVKQLLENSKFAGESQNDLRRQAVDLALKYSFVTAVTSLVVVKPTTNTYVNLLSVPDDLLTSLSGGCSACQNVELFSRFGEDYDYTEPLLFKNYDGSLELPEGMFKLGLNETFSEAVKCSNSLLNSEGHCRLIHSCLTDGLSVRAEDYMDHFCEPKKGYAGICCPDHWYKEN